MRFKSPYANNAVTSITHSNSSGTQIVKHSYTYDSTNNIVEYLNSLDGSTSYDYDFLGQLISADYSNAEITDESYTYDSNGNRLTANGDEYTTGTNNELTSDSNWTYTYDDEGNRISKTNSTHRELYEWDYRNRLTSVTQQTYNAETETWTTTQTIEYTYDYNNVWIRKVVGNDKTIFIPENYQTTAQIDNGTVTHHYLWTPNTQDKLLADTTSSEILWSLTDHLGTIRDIIGTTTNTHIIYDAYGNIISCKNSAAQTVDNPLLFAYTGKAFDTSTQLQNNINRWYDATIGRWLSQDPIGFEGNDTNLYRYVGNMVHYTDSIGLKKCGPRVWLYTGSWCAENNVWEAAIEAAGNALLCWWKCEAEIHECVAGKLLLVTETISGSWSVITSRIPKRPEEIFNPKDIYKGAVRNIINKLGFKGSQAERIARAMVRGPWKPVAIVAKGVFATTMVVEAGFSISCGYKCGSGNEFSIRG